MAGNVAEGGQREGIGVVPTLPNVAEFERFMTDKLHRIAGIKETKSSPALRQVKYTTELPLRNQYRISGDWAALSGREGPAPRRKCSASSPC